MKSIAFKMKLNAGQVDEYKKRHDEIWPELQKLLKDNGIYDYSRNQRPFCRSKAIGQRLFPRFGQYRNCPKMVETHGRYHGNQSRQLPYYGAAQRSFLYGIIEEVGLVLKKCKPICSLKRIIRIPHKLLLD